MRRIGAPGATINRLARARGIDPARDHAKDHARLLASGPPHLQWQAYSVPTYPAADATTKARCFQLIDIAAQQTMLAPIGTEIPWNPAWQLPDSFTTTGGDRIVNIIDELSGRLWCLWMLKNDWWSRFAAAWHLPNAQAGYDWQNPSHLVVGSLDIPKVSVFDATDAQMGGSRGCGLFKPAGIIRAAEILAGRIIHTVEWTTSNPAYGVYATNPDGTIRRDSAGRPIIETPVPFRRPALRLEHRDPATLGLGNVTGGTGTPARPLDLTLGSGHTMAHDLTPAEVDTIARRWANPGASLAEAALHRTMIVLGAALGLVEGYGGTVMETGGYGVGHETDGTLNPATRALWARAGIVDQASASRVDGFLGELFNRDGRWFTIAEPAA